MKDKNEKLRRKRFETFLDLLPWRGKAKKLKKAQKLKEAQRIKDMEYKIEDLERSLKRSRLSLADKDRHIADLDRYIEDKRYLEPIPVEVETHLEGKDDFQILQDREMARIEEEKTKPKLFGSIFKKKKSSFPSP